VVEFFGEIHYNSNITTVPGKMPDKPLLSRTQTTRQEIGQHGHPLWELQQAVPRGRRKNSREGRAL
jgi:hypothetical protein